MSAYGISWVRSEDLSLVEFVELTEDPKYGRTADTITRAFDALQYLTKDESLTIDQVRDLTMDLAGWVGLLRWRFKWASQDAVALVLAAHRAEVDE